MEEKQVLALGFFDGVHLGHQDLLRACREMADSLSCKAGVLTFESHPDSLVFGRTPGFINTLSDRDRLLRRYGMETVISLPFDRDLMVMPWQDFYRMLRRDYGACGIVCGEDFTFGYRGKGNATLLQQACREDGIGCTVVPQRKIEGIPVSSTVIRGLLQSGEMEMANRFLGHTHVLTGTVVPGKQLGRTIGIPTANIAFPAELQSLRSGVYACTVSFEGESYAAVVNVGTRPTVSGSGINVESWILDYDGDLYGKSLEVRFYTFVRPERKFDSLEDLQAEIRKNADETRRFFASVGKTSQDQPKYMENG